MPQTLPRKNAVKLVLEQGEINFDSVDTALKKTKKWIGVSPF
ncbi:MAG: hypothetical protein WKF92_10810 [Pyrinomonadaceae bacterium]